MAEVPSTNRLKNRVYFVILILVVTALTLLRARLRSVSQNDSLPIKSGKALLSCDFNERGFSCSAGNGPISKQIGFFARVLLNSGGSTLNLTVMDHLVGFQLEEIFSNYDNWYGSIDDFAMCSHIYIGIGSPNVFDKPGGMYGDRLSFHTAEEAFRLFKTDNDDSTGLYLVHNQPKPLDSQLCIEHGNELLCFVKQSTRTSIRSGLLIPNIGNSPKKVLEFKRGFRGVFIPEVMDEFKKTSEVCKKIIIAVDESFGAMYNYVKYGNFFNIEKITDMTIRQALEAFDNQTKDENICVFAVKEAEPSCKIEDDSVVCGEVKGKSVLVLEDKAVVLNINEKGAWNQADISAEDRQLMNPLSTLVTFDCESSESSIRAVFWPSKSLNKSKFMAQIHYIEEVFNKFQTEKFVITTLRKEKPFCRFEEMKTEDARIFHCGDDLLKNHGFINSNGDLLDVEPSLIEPKMNEAWNQEIAHFASQCKTLHVAVSSLSDLRSLHSAFSAIAEFNSRFNGVGVPTTDGACLYFRIGKSNQ